MQKVKGMGGGFGKIYKKIEHSENEERIVQNFGGATEDKPRKTKQNKIEEFLRVTDSVGSKRADI